MAFFGRSLKPTDKATGAQAAEAEAGAAKTSPEFSSSPAKPPSRESREARSASTVPEAPADEPEPAGATPEARPAAAAPPRRHRLRRWALRAGIVGLVFLLLAIVAVQVVLATTLPRSLVLGQLEKQLGLRASARSLHTGWFGNTYLSDVQLSLPLAQQSFVDVPSMRVKHTWLPLLILGFSVEVKSVEIDSPTLHVVQDRAGRWNLLEVAELIGRAGGKKQGQDESGKATEPPKLPGIRVNDAKVLVTDNVGRAATIDHVTVTGDPDGPLVYDYKVDVPRHVSLSGRVAPGGDWSHQVAIDISNINDWARPWKAGLPPIQLKAQWNGQAGTAIGGRLRIDSLTAGTASVSGAADVTSQAGAIEVRPVKLAMTTGQPLAPTIVVSNGMVSFDGKQATAQALQILASGGAIRVDGNYDIAAQGGHILALWQELALAPPSNGKSRGASTSGSIDATIATRLQGRPEVTAHLNSTGALTDTRGWDGKLDITAGGSVWSSLDWQVTANSLLLKGPKHNVPLNGMTLEGRVRGTLLTLASVRLPEAPGGVAQSSSGQAVGRHVSATGELDTNQGKGSLTISGDGWPVPLIEDEALAFNIDTTIDKHLFTLKQLTFRAAEASVSAHGTYDTDNPKPVSLTVEVANNPDAPPKQGLQAARNRAVAAAAGSTPGAPPPPPVLRGDLDGIVTVSGTLSPLVLNVDQGQLTSKDLWFRDRPIGNIAAKLDGKVTDTGVDLHTEHLKLFGGDWVFTADYVHEEEATAIQIRVDDLPVAELGELARQQGVAGTASGGWSIYIPGLIASADKVRVNGRMVVKDLKAANGAVIVDLVQAAMDVKAGQLTVTPVELRRGDGKINFSIVGDLSAQRHLEVRDLKIDKWPVPVDAAGLSATASGGSDTIVVDLPDPGNAKPELRPWRVNTPSIQLATAIALEPKSVANPGPAAVPLGDASVLLAMEDRVLDIRDLEATLLGATSTRSRRLTSTIRSWRELTHQWKTWTWRGSVNSFRRSIGWAGSSTARFGSRPLSRRPTR